MGNRWDHLSLHLFIIYIYEIGSIPEANSKGKKKKGLVSRSWISSWFALLAQGEVCLRLDSLSSFSGPQRSSKNQEEAQAGAASASSCFAAPLDYSSFQDADLGVEGRHHYQWEIVFAGERPSQRSSSSRSHSFRRSFPTELLLLLIYWRTDQRKSYPWPPLSLFLSLAQPGLQWLFAPPFLLFHSHLCCHHKSGRKESEFGWYSVS